MYNLMYSLTKYNIVKIMDCLTPPSSTVKCWLSFCTEWLYAVCALSYCCGKQVVFFSHSRSLLKQRAFSINLSISAATPLTAGWRAGSEVGKVQYKHTDTHRMWVVAWRAQWEVTHVPVYVNEFCIRGYRWKERQSSSVGKETLMRWMELVQRWDGAFAVQLKRGFIVCFNVHWWHRGGVCSTINPLHLRQYWQLTLPKCL